MNANRGARQASNGHARTTSIGQDWRLPRGLLLIYTGLLIYGSLYPFVGWNLANWPTAIQGLLGWPHWRPRSDMITNLLVYIPFGLMLSAILQRPQQFWQRGVLAVALAAALSLSMELLQAALPGRVASLRDLFWNTLGAALGAACHAACARSRPVRIGWQRIRRHWLQDDALSTVGIAVLALWLLAQWLPLSADFDSDRMLTEVRQLWFRLQHTSAFSQPRLIGEFLQLLAIGLIWLSMARPHRRSLGMLLGLIVFATAMQWLLIDRRIQVERIAALCLCLPALYALRSRPASWAPVAIPALVIAFLVEGIDSRFDWGVFNRDFNWLPFIGNIGRIHSLPGLAETLWQFAALAYLAIYTLPKADDALMVKRLSLLGLVAVLGLSTLVEWLQMGLPDRWPDITDLILAGAGWLLTIWYYSSLRAARTSALADR